MNTVQMRDLGQLLAGQRKYIVPDYQRSYVWQSNNWSDMWGDLENAKRTAGGTSDFEHFTGVVVLESTDTQNDFRLVDGQQRLLTCLIIVCAIVQVWKEKKCCTRPNLVTIAKPMLYRDIDTKDYRIAPKSGSDEEQFEAICDHALGSVGSGKLTTPPGLLVESYNHFIGLASKKSCDDLFQFYTIISKKFRVGQVENNQDEMSHSAYFFDCLNNRGRQLTAFDQLRNTIFLKSGSRASSYYKRWWKHFDDDVWWTEQEQNNLLKLAATIRSVSIKSVSHFAPIGAAEAFRFYLRHISSTAVHKTKFEEEISAFSEYSRHYRAELDGAVSPDPLGVVRFLERGGVGILQADATWLPVVIQIRGIDCCTCRKGLLLLIEKYLIFSGIVHGISSINQSTINLMEKIDNIHGATRTSHSCDHLISQFKYCLTCRRPPYPTSRRQIVGALLRSPVGSVKHFFQKQLMTYVLYKIDRSLRRISVPEPVDDLYIDRHDTWDWTVPGLHHPPFQRIAAYSVYTDTRRISANIPMPTSHLKRMEEIDNRQRDLENGLFVLWPS